MTSKRSYLVAAAVLALGGALPAQSATLPEIRTSPANAVPQCVTPERLMAFLRQRNGTLPSRFHDIASHYKYYGEAWRVRWDYAFFQMAIETNFLSYLRPNGRMGDVDPKQNNFAGLGTTGGGVPGDSFPDVKTGVLAQIQHLVVYSGETVAEPVAPRTRLKQQHILAKSHELKRPVRYSDLARRWAADPKYASSIEWVASRFREQYCAKGGAPARAEVLPWQQSSQSRSESRDTAGEAPAVSPVRTVWSGGGGDDGAFRMEAEGGSAKKQPAPAAKAKPPVVAAVPMRAPNPPETAAAGTPQAVDESLPAEPVAAVDPGAVAGEPEEHRFALFTPPAWLASALAPAAAEPSSSETPRAVAGSTVGGFMIAGVSAKREFAPPSGLGVKPGRCVVEAATFGGDTTTVLVKTMEGADVHYVALSVLDGFEDSMTKSFLAARPGGGEQLGAYPTKEAALAQARTLCPAE